MKCLLSILLLWPLVLTAQQTISASFPVAATPSSPGVINSSAISANSYSNSGNVTATVVPTIQSGSDFLLVFVTWEDAPTYCSTVSKPSSAHATYSASPLVTTQNGNNYWSMVWEGTITGGYTGSETINYTFGSTGATCGITLTSVEIKPVSGGTGAFDKSALGGGGFQVQPFPSGTTATTTHANEVLVAWSINNAAQTAVAPFADNFIWADQFYFINANISSEVVSSTGAYQATWSASTSGFPSAAIMTFY